MVRAVRVLVVTLLFITAHCYGEGSPLLSKMTESSGHHNVNMAYPGYTDISNFPFSVSISSGLILLGGGTLVKQNWVLTTASAVHGINTTYLSVRVGSNTFYSNGTVHKVTRVVEHPLFPSNTSNNIALLQLDSPVYRKVAKSISFLSMSPFVYNGYAGNVTGFGYDSDGSIHHQPNLQVKQVAVHTSRWCRDYYGKGYDIIPDRIICTLYSSYWSFNLCYGDSGDPLTICVSPTQCQLIGIYTPIPYVCTSTSLFVDIGHFYSWITDIIGV